eukprot:6213717-Pleurochrysis_carterae.AAC.4
MILSAIQVPASSPREWTTARMSASVISKPLHYSGQIAFANEQSDDPVMPQSNWRPSWGQKISITGTVTMMCERANFQLPGSKGSKF